MARKEETDLVAQLRKAIQASGRSLRDISREAGVHPSQLSYFLRGKRDLNLAAAGRLFQVLGLEVVAQKKPKKPAK
jgi:transcriptional regulator with XRE-family HTH domain